MASAPAMRRLRSIRLLLLLQLLWLHSNAFDHAIAFSTRGMTPDEKALYSGKTSFKCGDGSKTLPIEKFNDDFCDCPDGTDEPGTSACPLGSFYCANRGHIPTTLPSSRVNDGICDCCDGSDEYNGWVKCPRTCAEAGAEARKELAAKVAKYKEGARLRDAAVAGAQQQRQKWQARLETLDAEKSQLEASEKQLREAKEAVEKKEREEREWREKMEKEQQERERLEKEGRQKADAQQQQQPHGQEEPPIPQQTVEVSSQEHDAGLAEDASIAAELEAAGHTPGESQAPAEGLPAETPPAGDDGDEDLAHLSKEELGRRVAERWTHHHEEGAGAEAHGSGGHVGEEDLSHLSKEEMGRRVAERWTGHSETESVYKEEEQDRGPEDDHDDDDDMPFDDEDADVVHDADHDYVHHHDPHQDEGAFSPTDSEADAGSDTAVSPRATWWARMLQWPKDMCSRIYSLVSPAPAPPELNRTEAARIKKEHAEVETKLHSLRDEEQKLRTKVGADFGPEGEFIDLAEKCFELHIQHYIYEICPFKAVTQKEGHAHTTVGNWNGFANDYTQMVFDNGDHCWNGPSRSMKVNLECGMKTEVLSVEEPSRCEYSAVMTTPAVCTGDKAKVFADELARREAELASIHDEL